MTITSNLQQQINKAVGAHGLWKSRLRTAIDNGSSEFAVDKVCKDDLCDFGKWLHTGCDAATVASPHYAKVKQLHATFHRMAGDVLKLALDGKKDAATKIMDSSFAVSSTDLVRELQSWKNA